MPSLCSKSMLLLVILVVARAAGQQRKSIVHASIILLILRYWQIIMYKVLMLSMGHGATPPPLGNLDWTVRPCLVVAQGYNLPVHMLLW